MRAWIIVLSLIACPVLARAETLPTVDSDLMDKILEGTTGADRDQLETSYRKFIRDYEEVFKKVGLPGPDLDPEARNRRMLKNFKKLPAKQRLAVVSGARKEIPGLLKKLVELDARSKLDEPKEVDAAFDSFPSMSQMPIPTESSSPVYYGNMIERLGLEGGRVRGSRARDYPYAQ
jgi:hypothetical protein